MTIHNYALAASADDAREAAGTVTTSSNALTLTAGTHYAGFSFPTAGDPIPQGTTIASATITYYPTSTADDDPDLTWKGHKVVNSAQFTTAASDISSRYSGAPTTASVTDTGTGVGTGARTVTVTTIVQELVNQASWASSSRITLIAKGAGGSCNVAIYALDSPTGTEASLAVDFTTGPPLTVKTMHYLKMTN